MTTPEIRIKITSAERPSTILVISPSNERGLKAALAGPRGHRREPPPALQAP
jgi:hypothetical protein